jgi:exonuclease III
MQSSADVIELSDDEEPAVAALCEKCCGRACAPGTYTSRRSGAQLPFRTCCRGCAKGEAHDDDCNKRQPQLAVSSSGVAGSSSGGAGSSTSTSKRSADSEQATSTKLPKQFYGTVVICTWNVQSLLPASENKDKLPRLLPRLPHSPDLLFVQETQLVSAAAQKKLPAARVLLPGFTFHTVPVAADAASENAAKGTGVYVRNASPLAAGGALEVDLAADPWGAIAVWRCDRGVIIGGRLPVPRAVDVATRRRLEDHLESLLQAHGARVLAVVGDLNTTPDLALDATVPWTGAAYAASRARLAGLMRSFRLCDVWRKAHPTERRWTTYQEREGRAWQARCDLVLVPEAHATHAEATIVDGPGFVNSEGTKSSGKELAGSDHVPVLLAMRL